MQKMGKTRALVVDDGTSYGVGLADQFVAGFGDGGTVVARKSVQVGEKDFSDFVKTELVKWTAAIKEAGIEPE